MRLCRDSVSVKIAPGNILFKKPDAYCISEAVDWFREAVEFTISETEGLIHVT